MNKSDLAAKVYETIEGVTREQSAKIVSTVLDSIVNALKAGEPVAVQGFGTFKSVIAKARKGRNPITGEELVIPEVKRVKFVVSKTLKEAIQ